MGSTIDEPFLSKITKRAKANKDITDNGNLINITLQTTHFLKVSQEPVHFVQDDLNKCPRKQVDDTSSTEGVRQTIFISGGCSMPPFNPPWS